MSDAFAAHASGPGPGHRKARKRSLIPLWFFGFFAVIFAANGAMVYYALESWTGLEDRNYYVKGVEYNKTLAALNAQEERGWQSDLKYDETAPGVVHMSFDLKDRSGNPITKARVKVNFIRPTHYGQDRELDLVETMPGRYEGTIDLHLFGIWDVEQLVWHGKDTYQTTKRIFIKQEG